jgi:hypothetical protein
MQSITEREWSNMNIDAFSGSYFECRRKILDSGSRSGGLHQSFRHPLAGPEGEELFCDVLTLGDPEAPAKLVVESGLHGAEGFAGSAVQVAALRDLTPPPGVALIVVHAINPWGFAWNRRFNEDNIDLNRHFVDWDAPGVLSNPGYDALADILIPAEPTDESLARADERLEAFRAAQGDAALRTAVKQGQYRHPDGLYYGGSGPSWSSRMVETIAREFLGDAQRAGLIDIHTGLGPYGFGDCLSSEAPDSAEGGRASDWYGSVSHTKSPKTSYAGSKASILDGYRRAAPWLELTPIGLEFGTLAPDTVRDAVRLDGWLYLNGGYDNPARDQVKAHMSAAFNPADPAWQQAVVTRGLEVVRQGLAGLVR